MASGSDWELAAYQVRANRRLQFDNLMWQVPALSFTAQAFLLTIALGHDSSRVARILSSSLAVMASLLSLQLLIRQRRHELADAEELERVERDVVKLSVGVHGEAFRAQVRKAPQVSKWWYIRCLSNNSSFALWTFGLLVFLLAGITALVVGAAKPGWL